MNATNVVYVRVVCNYQNQFYGLHVNSSHSNNDGVNPISVSCRLSERFQLTALTLRKTISPISGFHHLLIVHFLASWKPIFIFVA